MTVPQRQMWLLTYVSDLGAFELGKIKRACEIYRQNGDNKFMATSGALLDLIKSTRTEPRNPHMRPTPDGGEQPWSGACTCELCTQKLARAGFYRAFAKESRSEDYDREQADQWFKGKIEPSKIDDEEMRLRNQLVNALVMDKGLDREDAARKVMGERTRILYPDNKYTALADIFLTKQKAEILARAPPEMDMAEMVREKELAEERAAALKRAKL